MRLCKINSELTTKRTEQLACSKTIRELQSTIDAKNLEIDLQIAWDGELRNDQQRKTKRQHMMSEFSYQEALSQLHIAQDKYALMQISIDHLYQCLSIRKLEMRLRIAATESLEF